MKQGINISMPSQELADKVAKEKKLTIYGVTYKEGDTITLEAFGKTIHSELFFDERKKMLMFKDPFTQVSFNVLGFIYNIKM